MAFFDFGVLRQPHGALKVTLLCLSIIVICLAKTGFGQPSTETIDGRWLTIITSGGYCLILSVMVVSMILGDVLPLKAEMIYSLIGCAMYLATGILAIKYHQNLTTGKHRDTGLALGSISIITAIAMLAEFGLLFKKFKGK